MYHEGLMPRALEKEFADHLTTCRTCMESLLNLQNDLFAMESADFEPVPRDLYAETERLLNDGVSARDKKEVRMDLKERGALFEIIDEKLKMIRSHFGTGRFAQRPVPSFRGKERSSYEVTVLGVTVRLDSVSNDCFRMELRGTRGRVIELKRDGRVCEMHVDSGSDSILIGDLFRGLYTLSINDQHVMIFTVQ
jgi:hypothetical protein